jgi:hypothetical protein
MTWERLPPLSHEEAGLRSSCATCGPQSIILSIDSFIGVGFGTCYVTKDEETVWEQNSFPDYADQCDYTLQHFEDLAIKDPDHDWRICFFGPLSSAVYQRHETKNWVLIEKGEGFA